jgi:RNA polymerase sigma-70 factor (ECF subfamily)
MQEPQKDERSLQDRLSRIETQWSRMQEPGGQVLRYYRPVYRYFMGIVRQPDRAEELTQQFAVRFLHGDFQERACPDKGRFRDFLKRCLRNMVNDLHRQGRGRPQVSLPEEQLADAHQADVAAEEDFEVACRAERLGQAWQRLKATEQAGGPPVFMVLKMKTDDPQVRSAEMAERLSAVLDTPLSAAAVRKILERARAQFADFLIDEVLQSLPPSKRDCLEQELGDLKLLEHCKNALERRRRTA